MVDSYNHVTTSLAKSRFTKSKLVIKNHVNVNNLPYSDRYFNTDWQFEMFKRGKPMDMILVSF